MIEFKVFVSFADYGSNKPVLVKRLECEGMKIPYDHLIEAFSFLYGSNCVFKFTVTI